MLENILHNKKKIITFILLLFAVIACSFVAYKQYNGRPERIAIEYVLALQQKQYSKAYNYLLLKPTPLTSQDNFIRQMQFWDYNSTLDSESYLAGIKGELRSLSVEEFSPTQEAQKAEPYSLADLQQQFVEQQKLAGITPVWKYFVVQAKVATEKGDEQNVLTTLAVQLDTSFLGRLLARNYVVDPCVVRTVLLEVEENTQVTLGGVKLTQMQQTNYNTLVYRVEQLFPGRYPVSLENPLADKYEGNLRLNALAKSSTRFNLTGRLQLRKQNDEGIEADGHMKKTEFVKRTAYVKGYDVFLKDRPSTGGQIVAVLQHGEALRLLDEKQCEDKQAAIVADDVTVNYNGSELKLERGQPVKVAGEREDAYICRLDLENSSGFVEIPKEKLQSMLGTSWYFVQSENSKEGWIYSELVN